MTLFHSPYNTQEKVASAKANSELTSVTAELTRALAETESLRQQLNTSQLSDATEADGAKEELERMLARCKQLESQLKVFCNKVHCSNMNE